MGSFLVPVTFTAPTKTTTLWRICNPPPRSMRICNPNFHHAAGKNFAVRSGPCSRPFPRGTRVIPERSSGNSREGLEKLPRDGIRVLGIWY